MTTNPANSNVSLQPQFYDSNTAMQPVQSQLGDDKFVQRFKNRVTNPLDPEMYFLEWHRRLEREAKRLRRLCEMYVTVHRRARAVTISDDFGYFGVRPETQGYWIDPDPDIDGEVHPINIVRPDIRANTSALLQINATIQVEPPNEQAKNKQRAERIQFMIDFFERDTWTEEERQLIFDAVQKEGVNLVETYVDRECGAEQSIAYSNQVTRHTAKYACEDCGITGEQDIDADQKDDFHMLEGECPNCGGNGKSIVEQSTGYDAGEQSFRQVEIKHRTWSAFEFVEDRKGARRKGIPGMKYLQTMELVDRADLEDQYPQFTFDAPYDWSYGLKCLHALANADWSVLYTAWQPHSESREWDVFEKRRIMLHESAYRNYVSPCDYEFVDANGNVKFSIKRGEKMSEAVQRLYGADAHGIRPVYVNERLIDFECPPDFEPSFRQQFAEEHFNRDSASFRSLPHWDTVRIQDQITLYNTIKGNTAARNSIKPVWFDSEIFDLKDFGQEFIPSKDGALDEPTDIRNKVVQMPTVKTSDDLNEHLQFLLGVRREVSGVQPAMIGEPQKGAPYAAQRQQLEQSMGLLIPGSKSYVQMKVCSMKQKVQLAFKYWTLEQFQAVASRNGEEWNEADVAELVSTDLERDVRMDYVPGTEVPQGNLTKELKFWNGIEQAFPLIQEALQLGILDPSIYMQLLKRVDEFCDFDFDLSGLETTDALAQKRYEMLSRACQQFKGLSLYDIQQAQSQIIQQEPAVDPQTGMPPVDPATGQPAIDPQTGQLPMQTTTAWDLVAQQITSDAGIYLSPLENPEGQLQFFVDEIMRELAKPQPNYVLVMMMQELAQQFQGIAQMKTAQQQASAPPDPDQAKAEAASKDKSADRDSREKADQAKRDHESAMADKKHEQALQLKTVDEAGKENDREHEREKAAREPQPA